jgi:Sulfotransferase family
VLDTITSQSSIVCGLLAQAHARRRRSCTPAENSPVPFIVGALGSGTGLLRSMLESHPQLAIPPPTGFLPRAALVTLFGNDERRRRAFGETLIDSAPGRARWRDFGIDRDAFLPALHAITPFRVDEAIRCFYRIYAARFGKNRWGDRTPAYGRQMRAIEQVLPEACFIHVIRDGRDAALSVRGPGLLSRADMIALARQWRRDICAARHQSLGVRHYMELRYESLLVEPETCLRDVCDFIEIDYSPLMKGAMRVPETPRVSRWQEEMSQEQRGEYEAVAGGLLNSLDYPRHAAGQ